MCVLRPIPFQRESVAANGSDAVPVELGGEGGVNDGDRKSSINVKQYLKTLQVCCRKSEREGRRK